MYTNPLSRYMSARDKRTREVSLDGGEISFNPGARTDHKKRHSALFFSINWKYKE